MAIQAREVADQVLHAMAIGHQPGLAAHSANVLFPLEPQLGGTAAGLHMPGTGRNESADLVQTLNFGHEFTLGHRLQQGLTLIRSQGLQVVNPHQLMALAVEDREARLGVRNGKGPHHHHLFVHDSIGELQHPHPKGVTLKHKRHARGLLRLCQGW